MSANTPQRSIARRLLGLLDLTSLRDEDDAESVRALAALSVTRIGRVAAFCTWPRFVPVAQEALRDTGVAIAVVANFPAGTDDAVAAAAESEAAVAAGAQEVDVVFPYRALLAGDGTRGLSLVSACRLVCGSKVLLKVILETGQLQRPELIKTAASIAIEGGADFLKTSTGKCNPGATPEAAAALLDVIAAERRRGRTIGLKVSGGVGSMALAQAYLEIYEQALGPGSATPATFRIGSSSLIHALLAALL